MRNNQNILSKSQKTLLLTVIIIDDQPALLQCTHRPRDLFNHFGR